MSCNNLQYLTRSDPSFSGICRAQQRLFPYQYLITVMFIGYCHESRNTVGR